MSLTYEHVMGYQDVNIVVHESLLYEAGNFLHKTIVKQYTCDQCMMHYTLEQLTCSFMSDVTAIQKRHFLRAEDSCLYPLM